MGCQFSPGWAVFWGGCYIIYYTCILLPVQNPKKNLNSEMYLALRFSDNKGVQLLIAVNSITERARGFFSNQKVKGSLRKKKRMVLYRQ